MAKLSRIKLDLSDSVELEYDLGITVNLRPMPNPDFDAYMAQLKKPELRRIRTNKMSGDEMNMLVRRAMAHTVIVGWGHMENDDDTPIEFSPEQCLTIINNPEYYDFYQFCRTESSDISNFRQEDDEDALGNSESA